MTVRNSGVGPPRRPAPPSLACGSRCARRRPRDRGRERVPLDEPQQHPLHGPVAELDDPQFASREVGGVWADLAIKCATHSGSAVGRKIRDRVCPRPIPIGFHAFHEPDFPPSQIRLCVAGFMTRFAHPGFHPCLSPTLRSLKSLSPPLAQSETQPTTAFSVAGCATSSTPPSSAHGWSGLQSLYFGLFLYQVHIVATKAGVSRRFACVELRQASKQGHDEAPKKQDALPNSPYVGHAARAPSPPAPRPSRRPSRRRSQATWRRWAWREGRRFQRTARGPAPAAQGPRQRCPRAPRPSQTPRPLPSRGRTARGAY